MALTTDDIRVLLVRELESFIAEIELFPDDEAIWQVLPGVANAAGNLAIHVSGNLRHFVGAVLGRTGYERDRDWEFGTHNGTRAEVVGELRAAIADVDRVLSALADAGPVSDEIYPVRHGGLRIRTDRFLLHLVAHAAFHLGQAGYLRRTLTGSATSSQPIPLAAVAEPSVDG